MKKVKSNFTGMTISLTVISLIVGGLLAFVNDITGDPIKESKQQNQSKAIKAVVPEFTYMETDTIEQMIVFKCYNNNKLVGTAVNAVGQGFGGDFNIMVGFNANGEISNYTILSHKETPGLGSQMAEWFKEKSSIIGKSPKEGDLKVSKDGGDIDAITAATITSRVFLNTINEAYKTYNSGNHDAVSSATSVEHHEEKNH